MDKSKFFENFDVIADAPNGVELIRQIIVASAVSGELTSTKRVRELDSETGLPTDWLLKTFSEVAEFSMGKTPPTKDPNYWGGNDSVMWVSIGDMLDGQTISESKRTVSLTATKEVFRREPWPAGTLLMSFKLTIGKMSRLGCPSYFNEAIFAFDSGSRTTNEYLFRVLPLLSSQANSKGAIKGNTLNSNSIAGMGVPLPPVAEQEEIIAKVDELMALCDELEAQQAKRESLRTAARKSALDAISTARTPVELSTAWERTASNWECIAESPSCIKELRQLILQVAMSGGLTVGRRGTSTAPFGEFATLLNGRAFKQSELLESGQQVIRIQNLNGGTNWYHSDLDLPDTKKCVKGDLLFAWSASFGPYIWNGPEAIFHYHIWKVAPTPRVTRDYLYYLLQEMTEEIKQASHGLAMLHMTKKGMESMNVCIPDIDSQKEVVVKINELFAFCEELEKQQILRDELREQFAESVLAAGT